MTTIDEAIELVRKTCDEIGAAEFARISGVPYTTIRDWKDRAFTAPAVATLDRLAKAAAERAASEAA